jgi:hypothetical protein
VLRFRNRLASSLALLLLSLTALAVEPALKLIVFDWDDTVAKMLTTTIVFRVDPVNGQVVEELALDSAKWREVRRHLGKPGEWKDWKAIETRTPDGSYRNNIDQPNRNPFLEDIKKALRGEPSTWQAKAWKDFQNACETAEGARSVAILTARGHSPEPLLEGLQELQRAGYIKHVPPLENLWAVFNSNLNPLDLKTSHAKGWKIRQQLDFIHRAAEERGVRAYLEFIDDDARNIKAVVDGIEKHTEFAGRNPWPNVDISIRHLSEDGDEVFKFASKFTTDAIARCAGKRLSEQLTIPFR